MRPQGLLGPNLPRTSEDIDDNQTVLNAARCNAMLRSIGSVSFLSLRQLQLSRHSSLGCTKKNRIELSPCQKRVPKKWHFGWPNENSETTFMSQTSPKNDVIDLVLSVYHFWMGFEPFFKYCNFLPFSHLHEPLHKNCSLHFGYGPITLN